MSLPSARLTHQTLEMSGGSASLREIPKLEEQPGSSRGLSLRELMAASSWARMGVTQGQGARSAGRAVKEFT